MSPRGTPDAAWKPPQMEFHLAQPERLLTLCVSEAQSFLGDAQMNKDNFEGGVRSAVGQGERLVGAATDAPLRPECRRSPRSKRAPPKLSSARRIARPWRKQPVDHAPPANRPGCPS